MKQKAVSLLLVLGLAIGLTGCQSNSNVKNEGTEDTLVTEESNYETIRVGVFTGGLDHYLAVIGSEEGIFQEYGINLELTEFASGINTVDAIVTGQADVGMAADFALVNRIGNT
ncbi:MAG: ABC transporter substrate-binding protein [Clostridiales bacterium]|nr:ABC transporter substrate-binding protein [Clostridiales bacterium]